MDKELIWLPNTKIKTPPFSAKARKEVGIILRSLQKNVKLTLPVSRTMPIIGPKCHELRIVDVDKSWRIFYRIDIDAIFVLEIVLKKTSKTPKEVISLCKQRYKQCDTF
jgi:phage-related protein